MKFGTGSNTELTQKDIRVKVQNDIHTSTQTNKYPPFSNCVTPISVLLSPLARQQKIISFFWYTLLHLHIVLHSNPLCLAQSKNSKKKKTCNILNAMSKRD